MNSFSSSRYWINVLSYQKQTPFKIKNNIYVCHTQNIFLNQKNYKNELCKK